MGKGAGNDGKQILILTATSGDTGKAALEGFRDIPDINIMVFYPSDGVSPLQKDQMQKQSGNNVRVAGIDGNFDDAQSALKRIFMSGLREEASERVFCFPVLIRLILAGCCRRSSIMYGSGFS